MNFKNSLFLLSFILLVAACADNDPVKEDVPEMITKATLTFTPTSGDPIVVTATDPDGEGIRSIKTDGAIDLHKDQTYVLTIELVNGLVDPNDEAYDVTHEVEAEGDEHMFFFGWTGDAFATPAGNGNIDNRADAVDYSLIMDSNGLPVGLKTKWTSAGAATSGIFHVMLKHQPDLKSSTSKSSDGETDLDITFDLSVN